MDATGCDVQEVFRVVQQICNGKYVLQSSFDSICEAGEDKQVRAQAEWQDLVEVRLATSDREQRPVDSNRPQTQHVNINTKPVHCPDCIVYGDVLSLMT